MPTISRFYGILIRMFFNDHAPPHFHARYDEFEATIEIGTLAVMEGQLPWRAFESRTGMGDDTIQRNCLKTGGSAARTRPQRRLSRCRDRSAVPMYWDVVEVRPEP